MYRMALLKQLSAHFKYDIIVGNVVRYEADCFVKLEPEDKSTIYHLVICKKKYRFYGGYQKQSTGRDMKFLSGMLDNDNNQAWKSERVILLKALIYVLPTAALA